MYVFFFIISEDDFRSSNEGNNIGYNIYAFDIRYQKNFENAQPVKVEFKFSENIPVGIYGYALVLTNKAVYKITYTSMIMIMIIVMIMIMIMNMIMIMIMITITCVLLSLLLWMSSERVVWAWMRLFT